MMNLDGLLGYIDLAKRKSGVPHYSKLTVKGKKYICLPWDRNPTTVDGETLLFWRVSKTQYIRNFPREVVQGKTWKKSQQRAEVKVIANLQGCLPENAFFKRCFK